MRRSSVVALVIAALGVASCGTTKTVTSVKYQTATETTVVTNTVTATRTRRLSSLPPVTTTRVESTTITTAPQPTSQFSGNGGENIGNLHISAASTIHWTDDGELFQVFDSDDAIGINSQGSSGTSQIEPGTYRNVEVNASGNWTIQIVPNN